MGNRVLGYISFLGRTKRKRKKILVLNGMDKRDVDEEYRKVETEDLGVLQR